MEKESTFVVNHVIDLTEDASYSLLNEDYENEATLVVKDGEMTIYFENDDDPKEFKDNFKDMNNFVKDHSWVFSKLMNGNHRWHKYNPNPKGKNTGDCTIRAYCAAFDIDWDEAYDIASEIAKENSVILDDSKVVPKILIEAFNCEVDSKYNKKSVKAKERLTVNNFAMSHPYGTYILHIRGHLVTCKNGEYWDSWDSGDKKIDTVYIPNK